MRPLLFYENNEDYLKDSNHKIFLEKLFGVSVETYPIKEHKEQYDHNDIPKFFPGTDTLMPNTCWCDIPDSEDPIWPKLHFKSESADNWTDEYKFVAKGDDIFKLTLDEIHVNFGTNISKAGAWET